jgi:hypothetical protein
VASEINVREQTLQVFRLLSLLYAQKNPDVSPHHLAHHVCSHFRLILNSLRISVEQSDFTSPSSRISSPISIINLPNSSFHDIILPRHNAQTQIIQFTPQSSIVTIMDPSSSNIKLSDRDVQVLLAAIQCGKVDFQVRMNYCSIVRRGVDLVV